MCHALMRDENGTLVKMLNGLRKIQNDLRNTCANFTVSTRDPTRPTVRLNPDIRDECSCYIVAGKKIY